MTAQRHPDGPVLVVGSGLAGWTAVREFRKLDANTPVVLITADTGDFYGKPALSTALAQGRTPAQLVTMPADQMRETLNVTVMAHTHVTRLDVQAQAVHTAQGVLTYRDLVLATGAHPIRLSLGGNAASEVMSVNDLASYTVFRQSLLPQARVLVIGAGLIGCEFANDLAAKHYAVQVVDPNAVPLAALLPEAAGGQLQAALQALGVQWHFGTSVQTVDRTDDGLVVTFANGQQTVVDVVLSAVGLRADVALAQAAGLTTERGIVVNAQLQTSAAHVYALGDNAQYASDSVGGVARTLPYVLPIMHAGKALAQTLAGTPTAVQFPLMPVAIKTPALPLVVASAALGTVGAWQVVGEGLWHFVDAEGQVRGFVLSGSSTNRRMEQAKLVTA
jgi:rubredoxin-NAD+ reductase